jgi:farnesol dehydrogenase
MRVLVTGATGYLGRAIVAALGAAGHVPVAFSRSASRAGLDVEAIDGDVRDGMALERAAAGCDAICHSAALVAVWRREPREFDEVNVGGLANVLAAARRCGTRRIVYTSSFLALPPTGGEAPQPWNDYQRTKAAADRLAERAVGQGAPLVRLYPGVIYGPGPLTDGNLVGRMVADHLAGRLPGVLGAECRWSYAFVQDVAEGHVAALTGGRVGGRYSLGGENARQMAVFEIVRDLTGTPLPRRIPGAAAVALALAEELRAALTGRPPLLTVGTVEILQREWILDSRDAERELAYRVTPLRDGIRAVVAGFGPKGREASADR